MVIVARPAKKAIVDPEQTFMRRISALLLLLGLAGLMTGCNKQGAAAPAGGSTLPPSKVNLKRNVELGVAERRSLDYHVETVGVLEAEGQTDIAAGVSGVVDEVLFREGDQVTPDKVLVKIDQTRYQSAAELARANEKRAENAQSLARDAANRAQQARGSVSEEERTKTLLQLRVAESEYRAAQASRVLAEHNLERSRVRAPYAGRINQRKVTPGTYVEEKTAIGTIADLTHIRLVGWVPETAAATIRELAANQNQRLAAVRAALPLSGFSGSPWSALAGASLTQPSLTPSGYDPEFSLLAYPNRIFRARIFYMSTVASPETHMFECKAEIETTNLGVELRPGFTARIRFPLRSNSDACVVPEEAVRASDRGFVAFVPVERPARQGGTEWIARARYIEQGFRSPGWVEVRKGIIPGELIIRRGAEALEDGTPIRFPDGKAQMLGGGR
jgi:membrane fusion protein, multidrug efflux system